MKSLEQMQAEMLGKARWDGEWPRAVLMPPGVIALARDQAHLDALSRKADRSLFYAVMWIYVAMLASVALLLML